MKEKQPKEKIIEILNSFKNIPLYGMKKWMEKTADQILELFEQEKQKWREVKVKIWRNNKWVDAILLKELTQNDKRNKTKSP